MTFVAKNLRYGMNNNEDDIKAPVGIEAKSHFTPLKRDYIQMAMGGLYVNKTDKKEYLLVEFLEDINQAVFKDLSTLSNHVLSVHDFENSVSESNVSVIVDLNEISDKDWQKAQRKYLAIKPLLGGVGFKYNGVKGYEKRAEEVGVSSRTLRRWVEQYQSTDSIGSLLDRKRGWSEGKSRIEPETDNLINEVINDFYLTIQRPTVQATIREVNRLCFKEGYEKPSPNTIRNRIKNISEEKLLKGRGQRKRAKQKFTAKAGQFPDSNYPLSVVQIDHTPIDIILVDDKYRKPIGRPYLTVAIDVYSRVITGYYIALDAPSVTSVGMCIARSILRKNELLTSFGIHDATWDVFGKPAKIHVDNGSDFRAESLKKSCAFHGIDIEFRPLARPEYGGHIERLIGTLMKQVHGLPGTTFSNIKEKDEYNSEKHASLTLHELETWLLTYITKVYHETIHSSIGRTPNEQWRIGLFGDGYEAGIGIPAVPENAQTLMLDFMPSIERTIQRNGVTIDGLQYYNASLNNYINATENEGSNSKTKRKFTFRQDPRDISNIWFYDPALKHYFNIPLANQALPAMSLWEYKTLKNKVREQSGTVNEALIYQAWEDMQSLVESSQQATKSLRRQEQRRKSHKKSQKAYDGLKQEDKAQELLDKASITTEGKKADTSTSDIDLDDDLFYEDIE